MKLSCSVGSVVGVGVAVRDGVTVAEAPGVGVGDSVVESDPLRKRKKYAAKAETTARRIITTINILKAELPPSLSGTVMVESIGALGAAGGEIDRFGDVNVGIGRAFGIGGMTSTGFGAGGGAMGGSCRGVFAAGAIGAIAGAGGMGGLLGGIGELVEGGSGGRRTDIFDGPPTAMSSFMVCTDVRSVNGFTSPVVGRV